MQVLEHGGVRLNNSVQASTVHTPFFLNQGRHLNRALSSAVPRRSANLAVSDWVEGLQCAVKSAKSNIASAQQRQKTYSDKRRKDHPFKVGDQVLLAARKNWQSYQLSISGPLRLLQQLVIDLLG